MKNSIAFALPVCVCMLWFAGFCSGSSDPFVRHGTPESQMEISADDVLSAIAAGRDVDIDNAVIRGDLNIRKAAGRFQQEAGKPVIKGNIGIRSSHVLGDVAFSSARFNGNISLVSNTFELPVDFSFANFAWGASFSYSEFRSSASFISASFNGDADFHYSTFREDAVFTSASFSGNAMFNSTTFDADVIFSGASFGESIHLLRTKMEYPAVFAEVKFHENTIIAGLWNHNFCPTLRVLTAGLWKPSLKMVTDFSEFNTSFAMDPSSNPYLKRYIEDEQWILSWQQTTWWRRPLFFLWELTSHCGRSIGLWAFWAGLIATGFAVIYRWILSDSIAFNVERLKDEKPCFRGYLYYSIVILTTLGFGDIVPLTDRARLVVGTEVGMGYLMLGGLVSIFANKLARRS